MSRKSPDFEIIFLSIEHPSGTVIKVPPTLYVLKDTQNVASILCIIYLSLYHHKDMTGVIKAILLTNQQLTHSHLELLYKVLSATLILLKITFE